MGRFERKSELFHISGVQPQNLMFPAQATPASDMVLLERIRGGDSEAFAGLVERYQGPLVGFLNRMVRDKEAARDLAQDVFVKAFQSLDGYAGRNQAAFSTWLFAIARNGCLDLMRSRKRRATEKLEDHEYLPAPDLGDPARRLRIRTLMEDALEAMHPDLRMAFELTVVEGFDYAEAAVIQEVKAGTVRSRVHRARELLQAKLRGLAGKG
jgi:RNA polymerase sigma-70 factor (ECF subfamily)